MNSKPLLLGSLALALGVGLLAWRPWTESASSVPDGTGGAESPTDTTPPNQAAPEAGRGEFLQTHTRDSGADAVRQATRAFNESVLAQREDLVARLGTKRANEVLRKLPLYKFDLVQGTWHRIDADGKRLRFEDQAKEDLWSGFQRR